MGTCIVEFYIDLSDEYLKNIITWNDRITPSETLRMAGLAAYRNMEGDIEIIHSHHYIVWKWISDFQNDDCSEIGQGDYQYLYIYRFSEHVIYLNTTTTKMA